MKYNIYTVSVLLQETESPILLGYRKYNFYSVYYTTDT